MKKSMDARAERSRNALLTAGMALLNQNKDATLSDIATHAGVGRATLYRQFETREQLIKEIAVLCLQDFDEATKAIDSEAKTAQRAFEMLFSAIMPFTEQLKFLMNLGSLAEDDAEVQQIYQTQQKELGELVEWGKADKIIDKKLPSQWVVCLLDGLLYSAWLMTDEHEMSHQQASELAVQTLLKGIKP